MNFPDDWYEDIDGRSQMLSFEKVAAEIERLRALSKEQHEALDMMVTWMPSGFAPQSQGEAMRMAAAAMKKFRDEQSTREEKA